MKIYYVGCEKLFLVNLTCNSYFSSFLMSLELFNELGKIFENRVSMYKEWEEYYFNNYFLVILLKY